MENQNIVIPEDSHFKIHRRILKYFGVAVLKTDSKHKFLYYSYSFLVLLVNVACLVGLFWILPEIKDDVDKLTFNLTFVIAYIAAYIEFYCYIVKQEDIRQVSDISEGLIEGSLAYSKSIAKTTRKICMLITKVVLLFGNLGVFGIFVGGSLSMAFSHSAIRWNRQMPFPMKLPFEITSNSRYAIGVIIQDLCIRWFGNLLFLQHTLFVCIIIHLASKFNNLCQSIKNIKILCLVRLATGKYSCLDLDDILNPQRKKYYKKMEKDTIRRFSSKEINDEMKTCARLCIKEHVLLIDCVKKLEDAYALGFFTHAGGNLTIICHLMLHVTENSDSVVKGATAFMILLCVLSEFICLCYAGNELTLQASKVADAAYTSDWIDMDTSYKKMIIMIIMRAQRPVVLTVGKLMPISNDTCVKVIRGAYSFLAVINSSQE